MLCEQPLSLKLSRRDRRKIESQSVDSPLTKRTKKKHINQRVKIEKLGNVYGSKKDIIAKESPRTLLTGKRHDWYITRVLTGPKSSRSESDSDMLSKNTQ